VCEISDFLFRGIGFLFMGIIIAGFVLLFDGVVQVCVRKKTGPWKEGRASLLAGAIIAGVLAVRGMWVYGGISWEFLIVGLLLAVNGLVQLCVRKKTGPWKEGRATLLAGAIIVGVCFVLMVVGSLISPV
jgi:tetrahydromethanopterin S-methyltransferase subunit E